VYSDWKLMFGVVKVWGF